MKNPFLKEIISQLDKVSEKVNTNFGHLNITQLNWKPDSNDWSIGQCLDHLIVTNHQYFPIFESFANGTKRQNIFERMGLLSSVWANLLKKATQPESKRKVKTASAFEPSESAVSDSIIEDFLKMNEVLKAIVIKMDSLHLEKIIMSSPISNLIVYSLKDACIILAKHEERHFNQAMEIMKLAAFPKSK